MISHILQDRLQEEVSQDGIVEFDPATITLILSIVLPLIRSCFAPTARDLRRHSPRFVNAIQDKMPHMTRRAARKLADHCRSVATKSSDDELEQFIAEAKAS